MLAMFGMGTELQLTMAEARQGGHSGACDDDVDLLVAKPAIRRQLDKIGADAIREELREYGAWDDEELQDNEENRRRLVWLACGNIVDEARG